MKIISNEITEKNTHVIEVEVNAEEFESEIQTVYLKRKSGITVAGFRKGKATRKMIEKIYGDNVFYEEAVNQLYPKYLSKAIDQLGTELVDTPSCEILSIDKETGVKFKATCIFKPEVNISNYKGLNIEKTVKNITDEDINEELKKLQERNARIVTVDDRAAQNGDTVEFDFAGYVDEVAFEGGTAENFTLELGSGQFIPGFEDQIVGKNIDEDFDVNVTFPEEYHAENLKGKAAVFKCKIHSIKAKELTEIDDEFAKDVSEFDTLDELKADIKTKLEENADKESKKAVDDKITDQIISLLEADIPNVMYENRIDDLTRDWEYRNRNQGIDIQTYLEYAGCTMEQFRDNFRESAEKQIKLRLALEKIVQLENIIIEDSVVEDEYKEMAEDYKMTVSKVKQLISFKNLQMDLKIEKAFNIVKDNAVITEVN